MNLLEAIDDPQLFAPWFRDPSTWRAWRAFLAALFGLPMTEEELEVYRTCTGRTEPPAGPFDEAWLICGRRGGKSFAMALIGAFLATFRDYLPYLAPGERATIPLIAADRRQARTLMRYLRALLLEVPMLKRMIEGETKESFDLKNRVTVEVHTASYRSVRGYSLAASLCDETAFWPQEELGDTRRGDPRGAPARPRVHPRQHAALRLEPACQARRALAGLSHVPRPRRCAGAGLAGRHPDDEPDDLGAHHRRCLRARPGSGGSGVRRPVPERRRDLHHT